MTAPSVDPGHRFTSLWILALMVVFGGMGAVGGKHSVRANSCRDRFFARNTTPSPDQESWTGFEGGTRRVVLPQNGLDGFQWVLLTQQLLADGGGRIRVTPWTTLRQAGKFIGVIHSLVASRCGQAYQFLSGLPLSACVEAVSPSPIR